MLSRFNGRNGSIVRVHRIEMLPFSPARPLTAGMRSIAELDGQAPERQQRPITRLQIRSAAWRIGNKTSIILQAGVHLYVSSTYLGPLTELLLRSRQREINAIEREVQ
jgi:hypothetical protein